MIRSSAASETQEAPALELTPLIDIVFIVIVFLLITANAPLLKLPVNVPSSEENPSAEIIDEKTLVLTVLSDAAMWAIDDQSFEQWDMFKLALSQRQLGATSISIATDKSASADSLVKIMALLNEHQAQNVQIVMKSAE